MGYMRHHAMVITGSTKFVATAHAKAVELQMSVSPLSDIRINGYQSFAVFPDGSKEGWEESDDGDIRRESLKSFLRGPSCYCHFVEIQFADDDGVTCITDHSQQEREVSKSSL